MRRRTSLGVGARCGRALTWSGDVRNPKADKSTGVVDGKRTARPFAGRPSQGGGQVNSLLRRRSVMQITTATA